MFAQTNRQVMMKAVLDLMSDMFTSFEVSDTAVNCHHNYGNREEHFGATIWVTRKGVVRGGEGEFGIIPACSHALATEGVECRKHANVIDETPMAYKDIDAVMAAQHNLVDVVHTLKQVVCVKG